MAVLRADHVYVSGAEMPHSPLTAALHLQVLESQQRLEIGLAYLTAWASMQAHPMVDITKAFDSLRVVYTDILSEVPYMTAGKTGKEVVNDERMAAIERYKAYRQRVTPIEKAQAAPNIMVSPARKRQKDKANA